MDPHEHLAPGLFLVSHKWPPSLKAIWLQLHSHARHFTLHVGESWNQLILQDIWECRVGQASPPRVGASD